MMTLMLVEAPFGVIMSRMSGVSVSGYMLMGYGWISQGNQRHATQWALAGLVFQHLRVHRACIRFHGTRLGNDGTYDFAIMHDGSSSKRPQGGASTLVGFDGPCRYPSSRFLHLLDDSRPFRCDTHDLGDDSEGPIRIEEGHASDGMIHFADDRIALATKVTSDPLEFADGQTEGEVLRATRRISGEVVVEHAFTRERLDEFDEGSAVVGLGGEPIGGDDLTMIAHVQILRPYMLRLVEAGNSESLRKERHGGPDIRNHPADLGEFESGDGVVDVVHIGYAFRFRCIGSEMNGYSRP